MLFLFFFILIILTYSYYKLEIKNNSDEFRIIGLNHAEIIRSYNKGEEYAFNAEYAVKYSADLAVYNFSQNAGIPLICNNIWEFNSWCQPDLEKNFIEIFNQYLLTYGYKSKNTKIENNFILIELEDFNYNKDSEYFKLDYSLPLKFKHELNININKLNSIKEDLIKCDKEGKDLNTCIAEKNKSQNNIIIFTIENNKNLMVYENKLEIKKKDFVFGINPEKTGLSKGVFWWLAWLMSR